MESAVRAAYRPRDAAASPLRRAVLNHLETVVRTNNPGAEEPLRNFLQCGIARFGAARLLCRKCGEVRFVPFTCKRRGACPSCDAKRAIFASGHALEELLPDVAYRQWVFVLPKRLRAVVHREPALIGEIEAIFARTLGEHLRRRSGAPKGYVPAQLHAVQRFGSSVNLHVHVHAAVSDGVFGRENGGLRFYPAPAPGVRDIERLLKLLSVRVLRRMLRLGALPRGAVVEILNRPHTGFNLDGGTVIGAGDRKGLQRLLLYFLRPALSLKRLSYDAEEDLVRYQVSRTNGGPGVYEWRGAEFVERVAALVPPPNKHLLRYYGALAPRSPLRDAVTEAAKRKAGEDELTRGYSLTLPGKIAREVRQAARGALKSWSACMKKIFDVDPTRCPRCGSVMERVSVIMDDGQLDRILAHQGLPLEFPKTVPSRAPPSAGDEDGQENPRGEVDDGRQDFVSEWPA